MVWLFVAPSNWVFWLAVNMRDFEKLPIWEHSVEWNMRIGVIISDEPRINDEIRVSQVRLIGPNGEQVGVIATSVALNLAKEANLDLVEVAPNAKPPVAKLIDYGKYKYNEKIKAREARRNQSTAEIKEIRFRLKIDDHDFEVKKGHVVRFLNGGDKVKVTIMLRGREQSRRWRRALAASRQRSGGIRHRRIRSEAGRPQYHHDARTEGQEGSHPVRAASSW